MMNARGVDLSAHRGQPAHSERLRWAELVLVMEKHHRDAVLAMDPTARGKTFLLGHWTRTEIPDPYRRGDEAHAEALQPDRGAARALGRASSAERAEKSRALLRGCEIAHVQAPRAALSLRA
jgi:protein-tyrosine-phosphatase